MRGVPSLRTLSVSGAALPASPLGGSALELRSIDGDEALSEIYTYTLNLITPAEPLFPDRVAANLDLKAMIGKELTVSIQLDGMGTPVPGGVGLSGAANLGRGIREISGIVAEAAFAGQLNRQSQYRLTLRPWLYLADQRSDYRIFQQRTVVQIVDEVLKDYVYAYDKRLGDSYPVLDYQVQYGETDFEFIQRLMQEHGIYWFFEHSRGVHRLVLVDHVGAHRPVESEAYRQLSYFPPGHKVDAEYVHAFDTVERIRHGRWVTDDFDFERPQAKLETVNTLARQTAHNQLERYEWPGDFTDPEHGRQIARVRMEEAFASGERANGEGNLRAVVCGTTFRLAGYPQEAANREYLVISARLTASETGQASGEAAYSVRSRFVVQPATTMYRPPRTVDKPRTSGPQTAMVTGPKGQEIWTDQYGRVKLKFHWDRSAVMDQGSSCWVRVSYPWAGSNFGGVNIPRVGTEVIVDFENGDPDRPIVTGRVFNASSMPPWDLPGNATQSGIISRSMKGGRSNYSGIRFEDREGAEEFMLQAEKDMNTAIKNNETHVVGADRTKIVKGQEVTTIRSDRTQIVDGQHTETIKHDISQTSTEGDISVTSEKGTVTISAKTQIKLVVQGTTIVLTPALISLISKAINSQSTDETHVSGSKIKLNC
ncbi:MAG: type secretion system secreted protein VgrG [Paraburkholderia sp.]|nr:type secretion system secreted protein VgrG [Paraburkholderia sp.]